MRYRKVYNKEVKFGGVEDGAGGSISFTFSLLRFGKVPLISLMTDDELRVFVPDLRTSPYLVDVDVEFSVTGRAVGSPHLSPNLEKLKEQVRLDVKRVIYKVGDHLPIRTFLHFREEVDGDSVVVTGFGMGKLKHTFFSSINFVKDYVTQFSFFSSTTKLEGYFNFHVTTGTIPIKYTHTITPPPPPDISPNHISNYLLFYFSQLLEACEDRREYLIPFKALWLGKVDGNVQWVEICDGKYFKPRYLGKGIVRIHVSETRSKGAILL